MTKALSALAVAAFMALALIMLPVFAPEVEAGVPAALAKGDRLPVAGGNCAAQSWPNLAASCLRRADSGLGVRPVRLVTADRR